MAVLFGSKNASKKVEKKNSTASVKENREYALIEWAIESRKKTQTTTLKLYKLMKEDKTDSKDIKSQAQLLVAVSFSLWRAAFLANRTGKMDLKHASAIEFVKTMLEDNAITFASDKKAQEWSFNYYIDNALGRLRIFENKWPEIAGGGLKPARGTPRRRWDALQDAFDRAVDELGRQMRISN